MADTETFDPGLECALQHGMAANGKPLDVAEYKVMTVVDTDGYSVRLLTARPGLGFLSGFKPSIPYVENEIWIDARGHKQLIEVMVWTHSTS